MNMRKSLLVQVLCSAVLFSADILNACSISTLDWSSRNIVFSLSNPDYLGTSAVTIEGILHGAPAGAFFTDEVTTINFVAPRIVKTLVVESKFAYKASVKIAGVTIPQQVTNHLTNEALTFDLLSYGPVSYLEIIPDLTYSSEVKFRNLSMDVCTGSNWDSEGGIKSSSTMKPNWSQNASEGSNWDSEGGMESSSTMKPNWSQNASEVQCDSSVKVNYADVNNGFTVTNLDYPNTDRAEAILEGSPVVGFVTDNITTITFNSPKLVTTLFFKSKFQNSSSFRIKGQTITTPISITGSSTFLTYDLLNFDLITGIELIPSLLVSSEVKYKDLYMEFCTGPCSTITSTDVTISPSTYGNILDSGVRTWIWSDNPVTLTLSSTTNIAGISIGAKKFDKAIRIIGKRSDGMEVFREEFAATNQRFQSFSNTFSDVQFGVKTIELHAISKDTTVQDTRGKVKEINIEMCPLAV